MLFPRSLWFSFIMFCFVICWIRLSFVWNSQLLASLDSSESAKLIYCMGLCRENYVWSNSILWPHCRLFVTVCSSTVPTHYVKLTTIWTILYCFRGKRLVNASVLVNALNRSSACWGSAELGRAAILARHNCTLGYELSCELDKLIFEWCSSLCDQPFPSLYMET